MPFGVVNVIIECVIILKQTNSFTGHHFHLIHDSVLPRYSNNESYIAENSYYIKRTKTKHYNHSIVVVE